MRAALLLALLLAGPATAQDRRTEQERRDWYDQERRREHSRTERRDDTIFGTERRLRRWWDIDTTCTDANGVRFRCRRE